MGLLIPDDNLKQKIMLSVDNLPPDGLKEVLNFLDYICFKFQEKSQTQTPYQPVTLGGLWKEEIVNDKDIDDVRREMWQSMENREI